jgi:hypothetical protein
MKHYESFLIIKSEGFSEEVALIASIMIAVNSSLNICEDVYNAQEGEDRRTLDDILIEQFNQMFWEERKVDVEQAMAIWKVWYPFTINQMFDRPKTIRELIIQNRTYPSYNL